MSRTWIARLEACPEGAHAHAALTTLGGAPAGHLVAWVRAGKPVREARRVDERVVDAAGHGGLV